MSVMICSDETIKRTTKVLNAYCVKRFGDLYNLDVIQAWHRGIATLNCQSYSERYNEDVEIAFDEITLVPDTKLSAQDILSARCWRYQIEGNCENDHIYEMVDKAIDWAISEYKYTDTEYDACQWG